MKPSIIIVQPSHVTSDSEVEAFCELFCDSHYVYLIRPDSEVRDDSPAGLRFLCNSLDELPDFPDVETVISVGDFEVARVLGEAYPASRKTVWDPKIDTGFPTSAAQGGDATVVRADFRKKTGLKKAM